EVQHDPARRRTISGRSRRRRRLSIRGQPRRRTRVAGRRSLLHRVDSHRAARPDLGADPRDRRCAVHRQANRFGDRDPLASQPPVNRRGIALPSALALLGLLGLLMAGAVASTTIAQRATRMSLTDGSLSANADYALASALTEPATYGLADLPLGQARSFD